MSVKNALKRAMVSWILSLLPAREVSYILSTCLLPSNEQCITVILLPISDFARESDLLLYLVCSANATSDNGTTSLEALKSGHEASMMANCLQVRLDRLPLNMADLNSVTTPCQPPPVHPSLSVALPSSRSAASDL